MSRFTGRSRVHLVALVLALMLGGTCACAQPASAASQRSMTVGIVLGGGTESSGTLQISGVVAGAEEDSFEEFTFRYLSEEEITSATLSEYDTLVLNEVFTETLSPEQEQLLSNFVTSGGKLIIHDADGTSTDSYAWLPVPASSGASCENCGNTGGYATVVENNSLVSGEPTSPYFIDVTELPNYSDALGDANLLVEEDPRWNPDISAVNGEGVEGSVHAYASDGGLIIYNGFDDDALGGGFPSGIDWMNKLWYQELNQQWDPDNLPHSNPASGAGGPAVHCGRKSLRVGVVSICANAIAVSGSTASASGNVILDAGISVGNGPVSVDETAKQISSAGVQPISLLRSRGSAVALGSAAFSIEAAGSTDPVSGKAGLAKVSLTSANLTAIAGLHVGGLSFSLPTAGSLGMYLDSELEGGLIGAGTVELPMLGALHSSGSLSLGLYANSPSPVVALGAGVQFGKVDFGKGWKFEGLSLSYQEPSDTWTASGGLAVPVGSLNATGTVVHGQLDSLQVSIGGQDVPLGDSGFFFTGFGGGFSGLSKGPFKIDASTEGFWGVPKAPVEPFYLDKVTVTLSFGGSVSLDGAVSFALKDHSPVHGQLHLKLGINPFSATGTASAQAELPGVSLDASGGAGFTRKHFTASESGSVKIFGLSGKGQVIASDAGLGASGTLCAPFHSYCQTMALAGTWKQISKLDVPAIVGGEPQKLITVSGVASVHSHASVRVPSGRALLLLAVTSTQGPPHLLLRSPEGQTYQSQKSSRKVIFTTERRYGLTTVAVVQPKAGRWTVEATGSNQSPFHVHAETVRSIRPIQVSAVSPGSSRAHPLNARGHVLLRWHSSSLPAGVRVVLTRRALPHRLGTGIAGGLPPSGQLEVPVGKLARGRNYFSLAATLNGVPFETVTFQGVAWRAEPRRHRKKRR